MTAKLLFLPVSTAFILCILSCSRTTAPSALQGVIDLTEWDFTARGPVKLDGTWEFYWGKLISPASFKDEKIAAARRYASVPNTWNRIPDNGGYFPGEGHATYRAIVKLPRSGVRYGLKIREMSSAYRLYVNGILIASNGTAGDRRESMVPQFLPLIAFFKSAGGDNEIIIHVSNYYEKHGGIWHSMYIGLDRQIITMRERSIFMEAALTGILFIMALYHLGLFIMRPGDRSSLYFFLYCLIIAVRTIVMGERLLIRSFPNFNWELALKLEHTTLYLGVPVFALFFYSLFREEVHSAVIKLYSAIGIAFTAVLIVTPARIHTLLITPFQIATLAAILYFLRALAMAISKRRQGALILLTGFVLISAAVVNDILYDHGMVNTGYIVSWGLLVFIFFQSLIVSMRFSKDFTRAEQLTAELMSSKKQIEEYNATLEDKVLQRTEKIINQNIFLEHQIALAEKLQKALLPTRVPQTGDVVIAHHYVPMMNVGGDLYDFRLREGKGIGIFICDVSGHGVAGAFLSSMVKMSLNGWDNTIEKPGKTLADIHTSLKDKLGAYFISAIACYIDFSTGLFRAACAGHPPIILLRSGGLLEQVRPRGRVISPLFSPDFPDVETSLERGDKMVLYTDGITEARDPARELFGEEKFTALLSGLASCSPEDICRQVLARIKAYSTGTYGIEDDITLIVAEYLKATSLKK